MRVLQLVLCATIVATVGCDDAPKPLTAGLNQNVVIALGQELNIMTQVVGPGSLSDPAISAPILEFVDRAQNGAVVPAGPSEKFRFRSTARGTTIITFALSSSVSASIMYADTVTVR